MRVLIAEDDPVIALGLAERVRSLGHDLIGPAADGEQAIELARRPRPSSICSTSTCRPSTVSRLRRSSRSTVFAGPWSSSRASTTRR
jgi:DNA-binding NarL/FixJ family response regulator